ncbi:MarR family winged helix-turn-helix transcriptional regulator [Kutzneria buriramensis]|uniref:DNA-binding MarR family transcriptional regulator n=1 Tax=Kutzneria buriramensis TaxID=1045776 RepID=A0A3E0H0Z5_9PSEU|nr:MarR family transcriptional regulator [Kutzneria buriramensis]REH35281.1 DNA-binding MarR family transcriptional regulator [Kutzneria buriramensis]
MDTCRPLDPDEEALVRSLDRVVNVLPRVMDATMLRERGISLTDYMTLSRLSEAPDRRLRMSELAEMAYLSLSGMTHVVKRLEDQGLVVRVRDEHDRRGWHAVLTDEGFARLEAAWPSNLAGTRRFALDHLAGFDLRALAEAFEKFGTT